jgi:starch phosphorylase
MLRGADPSMVCADFDGYVECEARAAAAYRDAEDWSRRALLNIAGARRFSIDNTVREYASQIWNIRPVSPETRTESSSE